MRRSRRLPLPRLLLAALAVAAAAWPCGVAADESPAEGPAASVPASAFDTQGLSGVRGERVVLALRDDGHGGQALEIAVEATAPWVRCSWSGVPADIRPFRELAFRARLRGETPAAWILTVRDAAQRAATLTLPLQPGPWQDLVVRLGHLRPEPGFDPQRVATFALVAHDPTPQVLDVDDLVLVPGADGWRLGAEEAALAVFGQDAARRLKHKQLEGLDIWSDDAAGLRKAATRLERLRPRVLKRLGLGAPGGPPLAVYVFGELDDFRAFCTAAFGWDAASAQRAKAIGQTDRLVFHDAVVKDAAIARELTRSLVRRHLGEGGGSWLQDGLAELLAAEDEDRDPVKELLPRFKAELPWSLGGLLRAADVTGAAAAAQTTQRLDYSAVRLEAAALAAFLLDAPDRWLDGMRLPEGERSLAAGLTALATVTEQGSARERVVEGLFGLPLADLERRWITWALHGRR
jgi:hypothetical protein